MSDENLFEEEPILSHEHALTVYRAIIDLKERANNDGQAGEIQQDLELLAPTTLFTNDEGDLIEDDNSGMNTTPPVEDAATTTWCQRYRKIWDGTAYSNKIVGSGDEGARVGLLFSTYSDQQKRKMIQQHTSISARSNTCRSILKKYRVEPLLHDSSYPILRDELWANYMAFAPYDTLTRIYRDSDLIVLNILYNYGGNREFVRYVRDCYCNELRLIDCWGFKKTEIDIAGRNSRRLIQQILRGYATSCMIKVMASYAEAVPNFAEFYIGKWRFPIRGFNQLEVDNIEDPIERGLFETCEIADLIDACEALNAGLIGIPVFKILIDELIEEKINEPINGIPNSSWRLPVEARVDEILDREMALLAPDDSQRIVLAAQQKATQQSFLGRPRVAARDYDLADYDEQVKVRNSTIPMKWPNEKIH